MTLEVLCEIAACCLSEYRSFLQVAGKVTYLTDHKPKQMVLNYEGSFERLTVTTAREIVYRLLDELKKLEGFIMSTSEPDAHWTEVACETLSIAIRSKYDINTDKETITFSCWYYPSNEGLKLI